MRILITGCNGQLGTELRKISVARSEHQWFSTDIDELNLCDECAVERFFSEKKIDICINCAAYTAVDKAEDEPAKAAKVNSDAVGILARTCSKNDALLIHVSTDYVFDGKGTRPYREDDAICPQSVYGCTKADGERQIRESRCKHVIIRTSWLYSSTGNNFVKTMLRLGSERPFVTVVADQKGNPTWAADLAKAIDGIITKNGKNEIHETFHFSNEGVVSWCDFANAIFQLGKKNCYAKPITTAEYPAKASRPAYSAFDKTKIKSFLGIEIPEWKESLAKCIEELSEKQ